MGLSMLALLWSSFLGALGAVLLVGMLAFLLRRPFVNYMADGAVKRLLIDSYGENLWELVVGMTRMPPHILLETELRAETRSSLKRPLGTVTRPVDLGNIAFSHAQLLRPPQGPEARVDLSVVLGPRAEIPLRLETPIMVGGMGYGVSVSEQFCLAVARGAAKAGAAYNAGSGPVLEDILQAARHLILQYSGGAWNRDRETLAEADMIEIRYGHGGRASTGRVIEVARLPRRARELMGASQDAEKVLMEAPIPGAATPEDLKRLVPELKRLIGGRPVGVKLAPNHVLEQELAAVLEAGVDVIALDGKAGGTGSAPPAISDEMGLPLVHGLVRAIRFLERTGARKQVSLIAGGGLRTPGEMLKALALGADAVYTGTAVMMAATHGQLSKPIPFEPVTVLVWADGSKADSYDAAKGAENVANFLLSCTDELREALRALGKKSLAELSQQDLFALNREAAETLGLPPGWKPPEQKVWSPGGAQESGASVAGQAAAPAAEPQPWQPPVGQAPAAEPQPWQPPVGQAPAPRPQPWQPPAAARTRLRDQAQAQGTSQSQPQKPSQPETSPPLRIRRVLPGSARTEMQGNQQAGRQGSLSGQQDQQGSRPGRPGRGRRTPQP